MCISNYGIFQRLRFSWFFYTSDRAKIWLEGSGDLPLHVGLSKMMQKYTHTRAIPLAGRAGSGRTAAICHLSST